MDSLIPFGNKIFWDFFIENTLSIKELPKSYIFDSI